MARIFQNGASGGVSDDQNPELPQYFSLIITTHFNICMYLNLTFHNFQNPQSDWAVLKTVLFYSVLILVLPIGSFFATKSLLFEWFLGQVRRIV